MKQLPAGEGGFQWGRKLVSQLQFIKAHRRYPTTWKTILPLVLLSAGGPMLAVLLYGKFLGKEQPLQKSLLSFTLLAVALLLPALVVGYRYLQTLRFGVVKTPFPLLQNMQLLREFLSYNHFAFFRHPDAPEVFGMLSRNLGSAKATREIALFIADEKRILVNSHFVNHRGPLAFGMPHYKALAQMLQVWISEKGNRGVDVIIR